LYPPLATVLFTPLIFVGFDWAYKIVTLLTVTCYGFSTLLLPSLTTGRKSISEASVLIFASGLLSYGLLFELERGQFNIIAVTSCLIGIWIFHHHHHYRWLAYILFVLSVQLKLYPFIFIVMFIDDWAAWRLNLRRIAVLTLVNCALLFVLGPGVTADFVDAVRRQSVTPSVYMANHSIGAFVELVRSDALQHGWVWLSQYAGWLQAALLAFVGVCLVVVLARAYQTRSMGVNAHLLVASTVAALLLPPVSWDYTLPVLSAPIAILLVDTAAYAAARKQGLMHATGSVVGILVVSAAYASTLFASKFKLPSLLIRNNLPALCAILLAVTCLYLLSGDISPVPALENEESPEGSSPAS
jgi:hypothetical protein